MRLTITRVRRSGEHAAGFLKDVRPGAVVPPPQSAWWESPAAALTLRAGSVTVRNRSSIRFEAPTLSTTPPIRTRAMARKVFVPEENVWLSPWAKRQYDGFTNKRSFFQ